MTTKVSRRLFLGNVILTTATCTMYNYSNAYTTTSSLEQQQYNHHDHHHPIKENTVSQEWLPTSLQLLSAKEAAKWKNEIYPFGHWPDPLLRRMASSVNFDIIEKEDLERIAWKLRQTAREKGAVGLAAQQCGIDVSMIFLEDNHNTDDGIFLINPRIVYRSKEEEMKVWTEACLVLPPNFRATLLRDAIVTVEYQSFDGKYHQMTLDKELARAVQHEMDHDRGILIIDHVGLDEMDPIMRRIEANDHDKKMEVAYDRFVSVPYLPLDLSNNSHRSHMKKHKLVWDNSVLIAPASASDEEILPRDQGLKSNHAGSDCNEECIQRRKKIIEERRAMMKQSRSSFDRAEVLELSRQRATLYGTDYQGFQPYEPSRNRK